MAAAHKSIGRVSCQAIELDAKYTKAVAKRARLHHQKADGLGSGCVTHND